MKNGKSNILKLINIDCLDYLKSLDSNSIQLIITSPPYNIGKEYEKKKSFEDYISNQKKVLKECFRVLKKEGSLCWQVGTYVKKNMR